MGWGVGGGNSEPYGFSVLVGKTDNKLIIWHHGGPQHGVLDQEHLGNVEIARTQVPGQTQTNPPGD